MGNADFPSPQPPFLSLRHPSDIWTPEPAWLLSEMLVYFFTMMNIAHAVRHGSRWLLLWVAGLAQACLWETLLLNQNVDNHWNAQSMIVLFRERVPLHLILLSASSFYLSFMASTRFPHASRLGKASLVGVLNFLLYLPWDILSANLLWVTWHDTDLYAADRHHYVPWILSAFRLVLPMSLAMSIMSLSSRGFGDLASVVVSASGLSLLPSVGGLASLFTYLNIQNAVPGSVCFSLIFVPVLVLAWRATRQSAKKKSTDGKASSRLLIDELFFSTAVFFAALLTMFLVFPPEDVQAVGRHEKIGPCYPVQKITNIFGQIMERRWFLCAQVPDYRETADYDEPFDFRCRTLGVPEFGIGWYKACGVAYPNFWEMFIAVAGSCTLAFAVISVSLKIRSYTQKLE